MKISPFENYQLVGYNVLQIEAMTAAHAICMRDLVDTDAETPALICKAIVMAYPAYSRPYPAGVIAAAALDHLEFA